MLKGTSNSIPSDHSEQIKHYSGVAAGGAPPKPTAAKDAKEAAKSADIVFPDDYITASPGGKAAAAAKAGKMPVERIGVPKQHGPHAGESHKPPSAADAAIVRAMLKILVEGVQVPGPTQRTQEPKVGAPKTDGGHARAASKPAAHEMVLPADHISAKPPEVKHAQPAPKSHEMVMPADHISARPPKDSAQSPKAPAGKHAQPAPKSHEMVLPADHISARPPKDAAKAPQPAIPKSHEPQVRGEGKPANAKDVADIKAVFAPLAESLRQSAETPPFQPPAFK